MHEQRVCEVQIALRVPVESQVSLLSSPTRLAEWTTPWTAE